MRLALSFVVLVALAALAPPSGAQPPVRPWVTLEVEPIEEAVRPLQGPVTTEFSARVSCLLADPQSNGNVMVAYAVTEQPSWATVLVTPASDAQSASLCEAGELTFSGSLLLTATDQAPALVATPITVEARVRSGPREEVGAGTVNVTAAYFSIIDVQLPATTVVLAPGGSHDFAVRLTNFGNGPTRVEVATTSISDALQASLPDPLVLESQQAGGDRISEDVILRLTALPRDGTVNEVTAATFAITSSHAADRTAVGDGSSISILVTIRGGLADLKPLPFPGMWAVLSLVILAAVVRRPVR